MGVRPSDLISSSLAIPTREGRMSPLLPHQKIMLDRALYMRSVHWENEQQEKAREQSDRNTYNNRDEPERPLKKAPRRRDEPESAASISKSEVKKAEEQDYCALWDGSAEGLVILQPIKMIPPKGK